MTLLVEAKLARKGGVYLAGECVQCDLVITNNNKRSETLAWCSAQIHCQEVLSSHKALSRQPSRLPNEAPTSFVADRDDNGRSVYSSKPSILFCELELQPGQSKKYHYTETLPCDDIPPSYKGSAVKYLYKLTIGVQTMHSTVKLMRIPFRVLLLSGFSHVCVDDNGLSPSNPFLRSSTRDQTGVLDIANQVIENVTGVRNSHVYNISNNQGRVARFSLPKNSFKLGEDIVGYFDFDECPVTCVQYCVSLISEEEIGDEYKIRSDQKCEMVVHCKQHCMSICHKDAQCKLQIPFNATPYFFTDIVHLRWKLHFEFVTSNSPIPKAVEYDDGSCVWQAPESITIETMVWDLPIKVFPCNPLNACLGSFEIEKTASLTLKC